MHKYLDEYPPASPDREKDALEFFPFREMSAEEYAARESHRWLCFGYDSWIYQDPDLNEWLHTLGDILFTPGAVRKAREKFLTEEEIEYFEREESKPA